MKSNETTFFCLLNSGSLFYSNRLCHSRSLSYLFFCSGRSVRCLLSHYSNAIKGEHCQYRKGCKNFFHTIIVFLLSY